MEELCATVKYANKCRSANLICITESWLIESVTGSHECIEDFTIFRTDRTNDSRNLKVDVYEFS